MDVTIQAVDINGVLTVEGPREETLGRVQGANKVLLGEDREEKMESEWTSLQIWGGGQ